MFLSVSAEVTRSLSGTTWFHFVLGRISGSCMSRRITIHLVDLLLVLGPPAISLRFPKRYIGRFVF